MDEQNTTNQEFYQEKPPLPNHAGILAMGIISIVLCWCYGVIGLILGIIALSLAAKAEKEYKVNPTAYSASSYSNMKAGRICAIIGTVLSGLFLVYIIIYLLFIGTMMSAIPWQMYN
jgi:hypothetical protein